VFRQRATSPTRAFITVPQPDLRGDVTDLARIHARLGGHRVCDPLQ
jgi:hypothetical protein